MRFQLRKCIVCNRYTLKDDCPQCNAKTMIAHPAKFSPDDKYLKYRLKEHHN
jgi:H/ACA ribonucleoprotein complex subunit 3